MLSYVHSKNAKMSRITLFLLNLCIQFQSKWSGKKLIFLIIKIFIIYNSGRIWTNRNIYLKSWYRSMPINRHRQRPTDTKALLSPNFDNSCSYTHRPWLTFAPSRLHSIAFYTILCSSHFEHFSNLSTPVHTCRRSLPLVASFIYFLYFLGNFHPFLSHRSYI